MANTANYMFQFRLCKKFHLVLIRERNQHRKDKYKYVCRHHGGGQGGPVLAVEQKSPPQAPNRYLQRKNHYSGNGGADHPLTPTEKILIVTGASHTRELITQLPHIPPENILIEPAGRNTAPTLAWRPPPTWLPGEIIW